MRKRLTILVAVLAGLGCIAVPAAGGAPARPAEPASCADSSIGLDLSGAGHIVHTVSIPVCGRGGLTVSFHGDPASCASTGLCDVAGTDTVSAAGAGDLDLFTIRHDGRTHTLVDFVLSLGGVRSTVTRSPASSESFTCRDQTNEADDGGGGFFSASMLGGTRVRIDVAGGEEGFLGTRCAGPLTVDLRRAIPTRAISLRRLAHGEQTIDLSGGHAFTAHGLTGTVRSTVVLRLGRPQRQNGNGGGSNPPGFHNVRLRILTATDRLVRLTGRAIAAVSTTPDASRCTGLDACGLSGTIAFSPGAPHGGSLTLATLPSRRRPIAQLRAALNLTGAPAPRGISVGGGGAVSLRGAVRAEMAQGGTCLDTVAASFALIFAGVDRAGRLRLELEPLTQAADPLRTRCPGPDLGAHLFAVGVVARQVWRHRTFAVELRGGSFADGPYRVRIDSTLRLVLRRVRVRSEIITEPEPNHRKG